MSASDRAILSQGGQIFRCVLGVDPAPRPMSAAEVGDLLNDPLAVLLLRRNVFPGTVGEVLTELDKFNAAPEGLPEQHVYIVGEGSQISWTALTGQLDRHLR